LVTVRGPEADDPLVTLACSAANIAADPELEDMESAVPDKGLETFDAPTKEETDVTEEDTLKSTLTSPTTVDVLEEAADKFLDRVKSPLEAEVLLALEEIGLVTDRLPLREL